MRLIATLVLVLLCAMVRAANFPDTSTDQQVIVNSNNVSAGSASLRWSFSDNRLTVGPTGFGSRVNVEGATPAWRLYAGGNPAASYSRLEGFWDSGAQTYYLRENVSGSNAIPFVVGINSGATLTFNTDGTAVHSGGLGLSARTNRLTISAGGNLLLDGVPVASNTETNVTQNFYASNSFFISGKGNTLVITQSVTFQFIKTNLLATDANGLVTTTKFGTGISWDPATQTISASGGGDTTGTNIVTLTQTGTNVSSLDYALVTQGGTFKLQLTNNAYIGAPANVANTSFKKAWLVVQQPSTGTCFLTFTNGFYQFPEGVAPIIDTNNGAVTIYQFISDPISNGLLHGWQSLKSKLIP